MYETQFAWVQLVRVITMYWCFWWDTILFLLFNFQNNQISFYPVLLARYGSIQQEKKTTLIVLQARNNYKLLSKVSDNRF